MSENGTFLSREAILNADDLKTDEVDVPEWGGRVRIRELTGLERQDFDSLFSTVKHRVRIGGRKGGDIPEADIEIHAEKIRVRLCQLSMIDQVGNRLFPNETDVALLGAKSAKALQRVFQACWDLSGLGAEAIEAEGKGSGPDLTSSSESVSPGT